MTFYGWVLLKKDIARIANCVQCHSHSVEFSASLSYFVSLFRCLKQLGAPPMASLTTTTSFFNKQCRTSLEKNVVNNVMSAILIGKWPSPLFVGEKKLSKLSKNLLFPHPLHASCPLENTDFLPQIWFSPFNKDQTPFSFKENTQSVYPFKDSSI